MFDYQEIESSNIKAIGYDPVHDILSIIFNSGEEYWYFEVPPLVFADFYEAESKGKFFHAMIKERYRFLKVTNFKQDETLDAIEILRASNIVHGKINEPFSQTCARFGIVFEEAWEAVMGRGEWYQYQPEEYKQRVRKKAAELGAISWDD